MTTKTISSATGFRATAPAALICAAFCLLASPAGAATNDLPTALQRGLFEEEANQNLGAAIQAYQTVAGQFDKDRKLAATAIFRLGECYRKQGNTNAAATQYERILREFSDQPTLVTLSRQNLSALGSAPPAPAASETAAANPAAAAEAEALGLEAQIAELKALPKDKLGIAVQQSFPNPVLTSLMQKRMEAEQKLTELEKEVGPEHMEVVKAKALAEMIHKQIDEQVQSVLRGLEIKRLAAKKTAEMLQAQSAASASPAKNPAALGSAPPAPAASETAAANPAAAAEAEALGLEAQIAKLKALPKDKLAIAVQQSFPNPVLTSLMQKRMEAEQKLSVYGPKHPLVINDVPLTQTIDEQIDEQVQSVLRGLEIKRFAAKKTAEMLQAQSAASASPGSQSAPPK